MFRNSTLGSIMNIKKWSGIGILIVVALAALIFDSMGRKEGPLHFTIPFTSGVQIETSSLSAVDEIASAMLTHPEYEAIIEGHTGVRGDPEINQQLSSERAEYIKKRLIEKGVSAGRIKTLALGGGKPPAKLPDEGDRSYERRLRRAEVILTPN